MPLPPAPADRRTARRARTRMAGWLWLCCLPLWCLPLYTAWALDSGERLRVAVPTMPPTLGNPYGANGTPSSLTWSAIFDGLTRLDPDGQLQPALAVHWSMETPTRWRFELRENVRFSNGERVDADAVVATIEWLRSPEGQRTVIGNEIRSVVRAEARDAGTVLIHTETPDAILPARLSSVMIVPPRRWAEVGPERFARAPVGTGPFQLVEWADRGRSARLVAVDDSWRAPRLEELVLVGLPDSAVRVQALRSREVDLAVVDIDDTDFLVARGFAIDHAPAMQVMALAFNTERERPTPVSDVRVRQALNLAIDREAIAGILLQGLAAPAGQPASRVTHGYAPDIAPYPYDPERARALLAEAGYPDGLTLEIQVAEGNMPAASQIYQVILQYLARIGVQARVQVRPFAAWLRDYLAGSVTADLFGLPWNSGPYNDVIRPLEYYSCLKRRPFFCEPEIVPRIEAANVETDPVRRLELLRELAADMHALAPSLFVIEQIDLFARDAGLQGVQIANRVPMYEYIHWQPADPARQRISR